MAIGNAISFSKSRELCTIENLREYLRRTEGDREGNTQLVRTTVPPLRPASKQMVRSWLTKVLDLAGIQAPGGSTSIEPLLPLGPQPEQYLFRPSWPQQIGLASRRCLGTTFALFLRGLRSLNICLFSGQC